MGAQYSFTSSSVTSSRWTMLFSAAARTVDFVVSRFVSSSPATGHFKISHCHGSLTSSPEEFSSMSLLTRSGWRWAKASAHPPLQELPATRHGGRVGFGCSLFLTFHLDLLRAQFKPLPGPVRAERSPRGRWERSSVHRSSRLALALEMRWSPISMARAYGMNRNIQRGTSRVGGVPKALATAPKNSPQATGSSSATLYASPERPRSRAAIVTVAASST